MPLRSASSQSLNARILLVDGNAAGLAARKMVLEEQGHKVFVATGVQDAVEQFEQHRFDLVVTDHKMPRMDGLSLIKKIHGISATTQVVLLSGFVDVLGLNEQTTGAAAVIQKSANEVPHLLRAVARLMKKKPVARERAARTRRATA